MNIMISGAEMDFPSGTVLVDILNAMCPVLHPLGAICKGSVLELNQPVTEECMLEPLTIRHEEGRRIIERTLRHVMLQAMRRLYGLSRVRVEYSVSHGVYVIMPGRILKSEDIDAISKEMHDIVHADLPIVRETWDRDRVLQYYLENGDPDRVELYTASPHASFTMYGCEDVWENMYGAMLPSTGCVPVFSLQPVGDGFALMMPDTDHPDRCAEYVDRPKLLNVFAESGRWCNILGLENLTDLREMFREGTMRTFIRVNEQLHNRSMSDIADQIHAGHKRIILIAGPSSSGKTTSACRLCVQLRVLGYHPVQLSMDNYYRNRADIQPGPDGKLDLESLDTLDLPLLQQQIRALLAGETVLIPEFDFKSGRRLEGGTPVTLGKNEPLIIEGIHGLNPELTKLLPQDTLFRIFVSALTYINIDDHNRIRTTDVRLLRRMTRDYAFRGTSPLNTIRMWASVRAGEEKWIFPCQENADALFNTTLHYELPFLKHKVFSLLKTIPRDDPDYRWADRLINILEYVPEADDEITDEIPPTSILREFIGGSTFDKG